jgi:hypothetical protein
MDVTVGGAGLVFPLFYQARPPDKKGRKEIMGDEIKETAAKRGLQRRFPTHLTVSVKEATPEGEQVFEVQFAVRAPRLEELSKISYFQRPYAADLELGQAAIIDVRIGDLATEDGQPIHAGVAGWKKMLVDNYPDLVAIIGDKFSHLVTQYRLKVLDGGFFPMPEPTSPASSGPAASAENAPPASMQNGPGPTAKN